MSKKVLVIFSLLLSFSLVFFGCKSKPEAEEENPVEEVAPETMSEEEMLTTARYNIEQAEKLKAEIDESGYSDLDAENYKSAGEALTQAKNALGDQEGSEKDAMTAYQKSSESVELYKKVSVKVKAKQEEERLAKEAEEKARKEAEEKAQKEATAKQALKDAQASKSKIEKENLIEFDSESYEKGNALLEEAEKLAESGASSDEILAKANEANDAYRVLLNKAYEQKAGESKNATDVARKQCLEIKADRADKKNFDAAQLEYISAEDAYAQKDYEKAYGFYQKALPSFNKIYEVVKEKKARADQAIERAKNKSAESEQFAEQADEIAPLPEDAEGFEPEELPTEEASSADEVASDAGVNSESVDSESVDEQN